MSSPFVLGRVVITSAALGLIRESGRSPRFFLDRHASAEAIGTGPRLLSAHRMQGGRWIWVLSEADRSVTAILLPAECLVALKRRPANFAKG